MQSGTGDSGTVWGYGADSDTVAAGFDRFADAGGTFIDAAASWQPGKSR